MKKLIPIGLALLVLLTPLAFAADDWEAVCIGDVLVQNVTVTIGSTFSEVIEENITCSFGCDQNRKMCFDYSGPPGTAVPLLLFMAVEAVAVILLVISFVSDEAIYKLVASLMALILLFSLALLATNVLVDGVAMQFDWLAWLNIGLAWVGVIMFLASIFFVLKEATAKVPV